MSLCLMQVVQPRYAEAIRLATQALEGSLDCEDSQRPLPYMFGSPEYLQVIPSALCFVMAQGPTCQHLHCGMCISVSARSCLQMLGKKLHGCMHALQLCR